jgi:hypothetical protein
MSLKPRELLPTSCFNHSEFQLLSSACFVYTNASRILLYIGMCCLSRSIITLTLSDSEECSNHITKTFPFCP